MKHTLAEVVELDLKRDPHGRSSDELRARFFQEGDQTRRTSIRQGLWVAVTIYMLFSITDVLLIPDVAIHTMFARFLVGITALITLEMQIRAEIGRAHV